MESDTVGFLDITAQVLFDDSDIVEKGAKNQAMIDAQAADWRSKRNQILLEMHSINLGISTMVQSLRLFVRVTGQTLDPLGNALLSMVSSATSLMIATATAMASTGFMAGVAIVLASFALGFQLAQTAKIALEMQALRDDFADINMRLAQIQRQPIGGGF